MSSSKEDALSPEELRKRLYQTFKNKGVLDTLKVQMRNQLIQELKYPSLTGEKPVPRPVPVKFEPQLFSACNSIVADHLRASGFEYTLSVFYPESGLCKDKIFKKEDLLHLLQISPSSPLSSFLSDKENNNKGFLLNLLTQLTHHQSLGHDVDTQTVSLSNHGESLVEKMKMIDKEYESFNFKEDQMFSFQSKLAAYRNETKAQMEAEMNTKLQHFKEVEIAQVRAEEKSKFSKELDKLKQELERTYEMKTKALMEREKNAFEMLQKQQEIEEKNVYMQRQSVLKEIETLRNRESELRIRMEAFEKTCQIHKEKVKTTEELLRSRELAVRTMEETYEQKLKNELSRYQLELKEEYVKRTENLTESENRNKVETAQIQKEAAVINAQLEEHNKACREVKRLQVELDTAQQQISLLTQQKELLRERLESTSDYPIMKRQKTELQGQLQLLQKQLEEAQEENHRLHAELIKPSKEQMALQADLQRLQNARRLDEEEFDSQKQVLQAQLQNEVERCAQLKAQLIDSEERSQWMMKHVEDIKIQLRQTHQALENEVLRNPKPSLVNRSVLELSTDKLVPPDIYTDSALLKASVGYVDVYEAGGPSRGHTSPWIVSPDSDLELVAEANARIRELQKEAETLEEAYRKYQQRAVHSTISVMLPTGPISPHQAYPPHQPNNPLKKQDSRHSQIHSSHKSKTSLRPLSPQRVRSPILVSHDTRNTSTAQHRVTFSEDQLPPSIGTDHTHHLETESLFLRKEPPQDQRFTLSNHSSHTPETFSRMKLQGESTKETVASPVTFPQLPSDRQISCGPFSEGATTADFSPELSPPHSPQLKSTARDQSSPPKFQPVFSSSESSPHPEEINLEDLTVISEPGHIPQLLLDTAVPLSEEAPGGPTVPHPQDLPEDPTELQGQPGSPEVAQEDDEQRWERERKERQERRQKELEEAKARERQELEQLEKEMLLQEVEQPKQEEKETEVRRAEEEKEEEADNKEVKDNNPLEKYMKMVLEARDKQHAQSNAREEAGQTSPEDKSLSEEREESIAAFSPKEEEDDFW